jgi:uncharacterized protein YlxW (UPF0749 family)
MISAAWIVLSSAAPPSDNTSDGLKIAIVGGIAIVLAAAIPALLSSREKVRERRSRREPDLKTLVSDAQAQRRAVQKKLDAERIARAKDREEIDRLERIIWGLGYDPVTGKAVRRE